MITFKRPLAAVTALGLLASAAQANPASLATFLEPTHIITRKMHTEWVEAVKQASGGEIEIEIFSGGALLPALGTVEGIASGVAQVGLMAAAYMPSQLPIANALGDFGFVNPDHFVLAFAYADFVMNEEVGYDDWRNNGVIYGSGFSTAEYHFMCSGEITSLEELKGKKARLPGGGWARFGDYISVIPVALPASEIYTSLERGALDCIANDLTSLTSGPQILELTDSIVMASMMPGYNVAGHMYNPDYWKSLTDDQRRLLLEEGARAMVNMQIAYDQESKAALETARDKGIRIVEDPAMTAAREEFVANDIGGLTEIARDKYGIEDPAALFALFESYIDKWDGLFAEVDRYDAEAMFAIVKQNLVDPIDVATYGME